MNLATLHALTSFGDRANDSDKIKLHHSLMIYVGVAMSLGGLIWGGICLHYGLNMQASIPFGYALLTLINFTVFAVTKSFSFAKTVQIFISVLLPFLFQWSFGGFIPSGAVMLWAIVILISMITVQSTAQNLFWLGLYLLLTVFSGFIDGELARFGWGIEIPEKLVTTFFVLNLSVISMLAILLNIYFVKRSETLQYELERSEKQIKAIVEYIGKAIVNVDINGKILFANREICELFGYQDNELEGNNINDLVREKKRSQNSELMQKNKHYLNHLLMNVKHHIGRKKDGTIFNIKLDLAIMKMEGEKMYVGVIEKVAHAENV